MRLSPGRRLAVARTFSTVAGALPWGSGQYHLARPLLRTGTWPKGFSTQTTLKTGARLQLDFNDRTQLTAFLLGDYSPEIHRYIDQRLPPGGTLLDVGANVGMITFGVAARRPDVTVHAFEPNPANIAAWRRNHALNPDADAHLSPTAVGERDGELPFDVPGDSGSGMVTATGLQRVPATTLDGYCTLHGIEHVDVIKLDVQGHEPAVLAGARRLLAAGRVDTLICEITPELLALAGSDEQAVFGPLVAHGFVASPLPEVRLSHRLPLRRPVGEDVVFERRR